MSNSPTRLTMDGNEAAARIAYKLSDNFIIYPITPSSPMAETTDELKFRQEKNLFGHIPAVEQMQSEAGVAGALHGALQAGSLATTFTCSQGLLLMIPNMYKIAGELNPCVLHVAARSLATHALSIFGDHQDVMAVRQTGFAMLNSANVQEVQDFALVAHLASLETRVPFVHFFDGFRTSHEINKITLIEDETIRQMLNPEYIIAHRRRALNPDTPAIRGTAQNPDIYFQSREAVNKIYASVPEVVQKYFRQLETLTGRKYTLSQYVGHPEAETVIITMGSSGNTIVDTAKYLARNQQRKVGAIKLRLYRPFPVKELIESLPATVKRIAVLDRTKECGAVGEPLYEDVVAALAEQGRKEIEVMGGRYGLSSKEFTPAMVVGIYDELERPTPRRHFTVGIHDDVTHLSIDYNRHFNLDAEKQLKSAIFYGLGSDGTVGANKNSIKIICSKEEYYGQAYFVYDSKKAGSVTESHLRFGRRHFNDAYLIDQAEFIGCHQFAFIKKLDLVAKLRENGTLLLNTPFAPELVWQNLPAKVQQDLCRKKIKLYAIDAYKVARETGMGKMINTIMQTCFFKLANVMSSEEAIQKIKDSIIKTYSKKGQEVVNKNLQAVDAAVGNLHMINYGDINGQSNENYVLPLDAPDFVKEFTLTLMAGKGDDLPVSAMPLDGTFPDATAQYEKRDIAEEISFWQQDICSQCGTCVLACPHSALQAKVYDESELANAPEGFKSVAVKGDKTGKQRYTIQLSPKDCTGCGICVKSCPLGDKEAIKMHDKDSVMQQLEASSQYFNGLSNQPTGANAATKEDSIKSVQFKKPLFEYSGACAGCGEISYIKLITQLFGDRMLVANATGCSSIYGGNLPTTPWSKNTEGRGPAWSNSLFEDNAEFGYGFRLSQDQQRQYARELLPQFSEQLGSELVEEMLNFAPNTDTELSQQRQRIATAKKRLTELEDATAKELLTVIDVLVDRSVWIIGGDGWAYDIGFSGIDHVLASGKNVNILVLDTEVYSNTGGQSSKATPLGAVAKFNAQGKRTLKKDLGAIARTYNNVYVAQIAIRANPMQALKTIQEAERHPGPSLIIGYSSCIAHGINLSDTVEQQKKAVQSGYWLLYRYNPQLVAEGKPAMQLDSREPSMPLADYLYSENRYRILQKTDPELAAKLSSELQTYVQERWQNYAKLAGKL